MDNELEVQLQHLENQTQAQSRLIAALTSRGLFGFFQRRRIQRMRQGEEAATYLREDRLRNENIRLKKKVRELMETPAEKLDNPD